MEIHLQNIAYNFQRPERLLRTNDNILVSEWCKIEFNLTNFKLLLFCNRLAVPRGR